VTAETIRTSRLELVPLSSNFVDAVRRGDGPAAELEIGARVSPWLVAVPAHLVQLHLAQKAAEAVGMSGLGRAIVAVDPIEGRRVIGTIGFHAPPDERGRMELGCALDPASRDRGYAAEAMTALVDMAAEAYGITHILISVTSRHERRRPVPIEASSRETESPGPRR
jgi:RimJ/RimL family protein N-acetyltransferase